MVDKKQTRVGAVVELNNQLSRWGWASVRGDIETNDQRGDVDIVAVRDGFTVFVGAVVLNGGTAKKDVGDKIRDISRMSRIGKPFGYSNNSDVDWVLAIKKAHTGGWFAVETKIPYVKSSEDYKTLRQVMA